VKIFLTFLCGNDSNYWGITHSTKLYRAHAPTMYAYAKPPPMSLLVIKNNGTPTCLLQHGTFIISEKKQTSPGIHFQQNTSAANT